MDGGETGGGGPPFTPLGHPVVSRYDALDRRIREDLQVHGGGAHPPSSAHRLQVLYLDFGRVALAEHGIESVRRALAVAGHGGGLPARDPRLREADGQLFGDLDGQDASNVVERAARLSRRALMTALVLNANLWNVRLALEVAGGEGRLERIALGTCSFVAERRIGRSVGFDLRYYAPLRERREAFCSHHCLPAVGPLPSDDRECIPPRTPVDCGMLGILEGFRFFASFPDE